MSNCGKNSCCLHGFLSYLHLFTILDANSSNKTWLLVRQKYIFFFAQDSPHLPTSQKKFLIGNNNCITKTRSPEHAGAAATRCTRDGRKRVARRPWRGHATDREPTERDVHAAYIFPSDCSECGGRKTHQGQKGEKESPSKYRVHYTILNCSFMRHLLNVNLCRLLLGGLGWIIPFLK